jgi:hypothetical protein
VVELADGLRRPSYRNNRKRKAAPLKIKGAVPDYEETPRTLHARMAYGADINPKRKVSPLNW